MKPADPYLKFVRWSQEDGRYIGYCPDLFPFGGVCDAETEEEAFRILCGLAAEEVEQLVQASKPLPPPATRPMREALPT